MPQNLRGGVLLARSDVDGARAGFMKALALDPLYLPALDNLAQLDAMEKKPDDGRKRYEAALARDPKNVALMTSLAKLATRQGNTAEAKRWLEQATRADPDAPAPARLLASYYLRAGDKQKALSLAQKLQANDTSNAEALALLAEAQAVNGQPDAAIESFERLAALQPKSAGVQIRIANLYLQRSRVEDALQAARKAVKAEPDNADALLLLNTLLIEKNAFAEGATLAGSFQARHADSSLGYKLEGDLLMAQQKPQDALQRYERGFLLAPSGPLQISIHRALVANGRQAEAAQRMKDWLAKHPADQATRIYFASARMADGDHQGASRQLEEVVRQSPANVVALNDLAWSLLQLKDPRALGFAEKAHQLAPKNAAIADTLAAVLLEKGETARALPLLKQAVGQSPTSPDIRLHLAQALFRVGDKKAARAHCEQLLALPAFDRQAEVRALMAQM